MCEIIAFAIYSKSGFTTPVIVIAQRESISPTDRLRQRKDSVNYERFIKKMANADLVLVGGILQGKVINLDSMLKKENSYVCSDTKTAIYSARIPPNG